jgi:hypothetical protein
MGISFTLRSLYPRFQLNMRLIGFGLDVVAKRRVPVRDRNRTLVIYGDYGCDNHFIMIDFTLSVVASYHLFVGYSSGISSSS